MELLEESLKLYQEVGDTRGVAWSLGSLANVAGDRGDHEQAKRLYEEGLVPVPEIWAVRVCSALT